MQRDNGGAIGTRFQFCGPEEYLILPVSVANNVMLLFIFSFRYVLKSVLSNSDIPSHLPWWKPHKPSQSEWHTCHSQKICFLRQEALSKQVRNLPSSWSSGVSLISCPPMAHIVSTQKKTYTFCLLHRSRWIRNTFHPEYLRVTPPRIKYEDILCSSTWKVLQWLTSYYAPVFLHETAPFCPLCIPWEFHAQNLMPSLTWDQFGLEPYVLQN